MKQAISEFAAYCAMDNFTDIKERKYNGLAISDNINYGVRSTEYVGAHLLYGELIPIPLDFKQFRSTYLRHTRTKRCDLLTHCSGLDLFLSVLVNYKTANGYKCTDGVLDRFVVKSLTTKDHYVEYSISTGKFVLEPINGVEYDINLPDDKFQLDLLGLTDSCELILAYIKYHEVLLDELG